MNGIRVRKLMRDRDINNEELARLLNITSEYVSMLLSEKRKPSYKLALKISNVFGVTVNELAEQLNPTGTE